MKSNLPNLAPAIRELQRLHSWCLDLAAENSQEGTVDNDGLDRAKQAVIAVVPADRRKELGWYRTRKWEKKSDHIVKELDPAWKVQHLNEVFIAGEALSQSPQDIVLLMMHQVAHQAAAIESTQSYHSDWFRTWMNRLFKLPQEACARDEVLGWTKVDPSVPAEKFWEDVNRLASQLRPERLDLYRGTPQHAVGSGKMYKWICPCGKPVVRTGGILNATCTSCHGLFKFAKTNTAPDSFIKRIPMHLRESGGGMGLTPAEIAKLSYAQKVQP